MLHLEEVDDLAREVAQKHLAAFGVQDVKSEPTTDSEGNDALRITITIQSTDRISGSGDALLDTLSEIWRRLEESNDLRFPIITYTTEEEEEELKNLGDSEA